MFLDSLYATLLQICDDEHLSYERAAERCACSAKHFSNIVCRRSYPSLKVFEQICNGFHKTPNFLLGIELDAFAFRTPLPVVEIHTIAGSPSFPVCPRCRYTLEHEFMAYCSRCGQCLSWEDFKNAAIVSRL